MTQGHQDMEALFVVEQVIRQVAENEDLWESHELEWLDPEERFELVRDVLIDLIEWFQMCEELGEQEPG